MRLVDSHCHVNADRFEGDADLVIGGARLAGVERILVPGWNVASCERALALVDRFPWLDAAVGVHPHDAAKVDDAAWAGLAALASDDRVVAIGETGLDYDRVFSPIEDQLANLRRNLALALETGKPAILHCRSADGRRDAQDALLAELRAAGVGDARWSAAFGERPPAVIHSYSGPLDYGRQVIDLGLAVSFSGLVFRAGGGAIGRGRRARPARPGAHRDRFAVPRPTRRAALAQRTGVGPRHRGVACRADGRSPTRSSAPRSSTPMIGSSRALGGNREPTPAPQTPPRPRRPARRRRARRRRVHPGRSATDGLAVGISVRLPVRVAVGIARRGECIAGRDHQRDHHPLRHARSPRPARSRSSRATCPRTASLDMKVATSDTADTLTFIFGRSSIGNPAGQPVGDLTVATKPYTDGASGKPIKMDGDRVIQVRFMHMSLQNDAGQETYQGPASVKPALPALRQATLYDAFEGQMGYYVGFDGPGCVTLERVGQNAVLTFAH